eukprot:CAMPEP_0114359106 /NCGR_PEP_ID=MMETSP0101-20121206/22772_1 /TAXON_ID=38822 ORGANISM="Pteridomonas danica, Strain PT" /NCGR_SAMPLE_ID=MMETSP0101 /ASSEMBLY_ACC=CAM_ASM_000211 /LENGTH=284 /DNA_ID=CAMNT_0001502491 /DNA_START=88 /DNA_END=942 /DNA_ORIENTATION=-
MAYGNDELEQAKQLIEDYKNGRKASDQSLWDAQELLQARCHPDNGEIIQPLLCFAAYVPMQPIIILGLIWPGGSALNQAIFQFGNQSYNAGVNYANKNKSSVMTNAELGQAFVGSVGTAIGLSVGMVKLGQKLKHPVVAGSAGFVGCVGAGWASLLFMRANEIRDGVDVKDEDGLVHGRSQTAAKEGIAKCCAARVIWNIPATGVVPFAFAIYSRSSFNTRFPRISVPVHTAMITVGVAMGVFPGQALFTQNSEIAPSALEPQFLNCKRADGSPVRTFTYNKGL